MPEKDSTLVKKEYIGEWYGSKRDSFVEEDKKKLTRFIEKHKDDRYIMKAKTTLEEFIEK
jgi:hypothetical protein